MNIRKTMDLSGDQGMVFSIRRYSIHDGPGIRSTVFLKGCPLQCKWCHNPEGFGASPELLLWPSRCIRCGACLESCPVDAARMPGDPVSERVNVCTACGRCMEGCPALAREIVGRIMTMAEVMDEVEKDVLFYDESGGGVTISGGEPFFQPAFLGGLLRSLKEKGIHTAVDTSGCVDPEVLFSMTDRIDLFLYDLKHPDEEKHRRFTGVSNERILSNLQRLDREGRAMVIRIPLITGFNDDTQTLQDMAHMVRVLKHPPRVDLLPYHRLAEDKYVRMGRSFLMKDLETPDNGRIAEAVRVFESFDLETVVGG